MGKLESRSNKHFSTWLSKRMDRYFGRTLQISSLFSILISLFLIVAVPIIFVRVSKITDNVLFVISDETDQAAASLRQLNTILKDTASAIEATKTSLNMVEVSLEDIDPLLSSTGILISETAPAIIENTNNALASAKDGARAADLVLRNLAKFSFLTGVTYSPEQSLDTGIDQVIQSLLPLPDAFRDAGSKLFTTIDNLKKLRLSLSEVGEQMNSFIEELSEDDNFIENLAKDLDKVSENSLIIKNKSKYLMVGVIILLEILLIGNGISKLALYYYGRELIYSSKSIISEREYSDI